MNQTPTQIFKYNVLAQLQEIVNVAMDEADLTNTCLNCVHFDEPSETCQLVKPPVRPPARVIAFGCPAFREEVDQIIVKSPTVRAHGFDDFDFDDNIPF